MLTYGLLYKLILNYKKIYIIVFVVVFSVKIKYKFEIKISPEKNIVFS